jgi:two-component system, LytTR family, sensor kinase
MFKTRRAALRYYFIIFPLGSVAIGILFPFLAHGLSSMSGQGASPHLFTLTSFGLCIGQAFMVWGMNELVAYQISCRLPLSQGPLKRLFFQLSLNVGLVPLLAVPTFGLISQYWRTGQMSNLSFQPEIYLLVVIITLLMNLIFIAMDFYQYNKALEVEREKLNRLNAESRFENLKNQLNPHFLFNSLNTLAGLIDIDNEPAQKYLEQLADVFRYVLSTRQARLVTLEQELENLKSYNYLLETRFRQNFIFEVDQKLLEQRNNFAIPPLSLQVLVENAVKHNIVAREHPLTMRLSYENGQGHWLIATNNLQPKPSVQSTGLGLQNLRQRLAMLTDDKPVFDKTTDQFIVHLPLLPSSSISSLNTP